MVWLAGGPATIDMWDLKPDAPEGIRGEFKPIDTSAKGVQISEHLPKMAKVMDKATVVRSLAHTIPSHGPATVFMTTGNKPTPALQYPALGSLAAKLLPAEPGVPPYVSFGELRGGAAGASGYLGTAYNPFIVEGAGRQRPRRGAPTLRVRGIQLPTGFTLERTGEPRQAAARASTAPSRPSTSRPTWSTASTPSTSRRWRSCAPTRPGRRSTSTRRRPSVRDRYGATPFGQGALAARRLVEAGVRFVTISLGGWDTHSQNFNALKTRLLPTARHDAVGPDRATWTTAACWTARSSTAPASSAARRRSTRTPAATTGRGRWRWCWPAAASRRGYAHGTTDARAWPRRPSRARRTTCRRRCSTAWASTRTHELMTPTGRPMQLFREGKVVEKLLA